MVIAVSVGLLALFVPFSALILGVRYDYTLQTVALGGAALGLVSGVIGCFAVLRQQSLMGDALSHAALPGVAIAFLIAGRDLPALLIGAGVSSWLGIQFIAAVTRTTRLKQDTVMGIVLASWFAFGIALLSYVQGRQDASQAGLDTFIFGQAAAIVAGDVLLIAVVGLGLFAVIALMWKEFKLITFDYEFARANGYPVRMLDAILSTLVVVAIVLGLQLAGVILMVGLLIAPASAARQWTHKLEQMVILAGLFGAFAGGSGAILSAAEEGLPTGPLIIVMASLIVAVSIAFAPERGLVWRQIRQRQDRRRFAALNVLDDLLRHASGHGDLHYATDEGLLVGLRGSEARAGLRALEREGLARSYPDQTWALTDEGIDLARRSPSLRADNVDDAATPTSAF
jgi:manganese/zinc/iron transport system permease protein